MSDFLIALRLALRARFLSFTFWTVVGLFTIVFLGAQFSGRQPGTVGLDVGLSTIRLALPVLTVLLLQEVLSREFDRKLFLTSLTYPRPRYGFLLGRVTAIGVLVLGLLASLAILLAVATDWIGQGVSQSRLPALGLPYLVTIVFVALDLLVVLAIGTLLSVLATTPSFVLIGTLGFMLVARSFSAIVALLTRDSTLVGHTEAYQSSLSIIGYLLPDLAALDVRMIALYGEWSFLPSDWALRVVATLAYTAALFAMAVWALNRKRFS